MKRVVADKTDTTFFKDADKSKVYIAMLDGREVLLVTYDVYQQYYTAVALGVHATRKATVSSAATCIALASILNDYIQTGYEVYEFDGLVEALKYITENI